ncbi:hypothetical protein [Pseudaestuariivita rosea]|uniref:hypothetical protein n=1 Tax=Pseudaestuariivita rosea TaxID=2763263 RepID=UPI001ABB8C82|nr:hypothetical protein [Pseudaestuariivita rosea]
MLVSKTTFELLLYGVPAGFMLLCLLLVLIFKAQRTRSILGILGFVAAGGSYFYFNTTVKDDTLAILTAQNCSDSTMAFLLPFGDAEALNFDNQGTEVFDNLPNAQLIAVQNNASTPLAVSAVIYGEQPAIDDRMELAVAHQGHVIPAGQQHLLPITQDDVYFLEVSPEMILFSDSETGVLKFEIRCT